MEYRRGAKRYDIGLSLRYAVRRRGKPPVTGTGNSINLSSSGLLFRCEAKLTPGDSIIAALDWPLAAVNDEPLYLVVAGYIVRTKGATVAVSISRNELLHARELKKSFEVFSRRVGGPVTKRRPILMPTVLVDEDDNAASVISAIVNPYGWVIERAHPVPAKRILDAGFPPISLLVTHTIELLDGLSSDIPVILTLEEELQEPLPPQLSRLPQLAILKKPLIYGTLRAVISRFCEKQAPLQKRTSV